VYYASLAKRNTLEITDNHRLLERLMATSGEIVGRVLLSLAEELRSPTDELPSTRLFVRAGLARLLLRLKSAAGGPVNITGAQLLGELLGSGLARTLDLDDVSQRVSRDRFVLLGLAEDPDLLSPLELLQVHAPHGTICYFSALMVHELTTQTAAHHHIAVPSTPSPAVHTTPQRSEDSIKPPPIGNWLFTFRGTPYYTSRRDTRYLSDSQRRDLDRKSWFRVTSLEQTLLDTLHRPMSCGGLTVVFDAWEAALGRLRNEHLVELLRASGDHRLARRVGYMAQQAAIPVADDVHALAREWGAFGEPPVALFGGIPYTTLDRRWNLRVP
jgi:hypothetical protein